MNHQASSHSTTNPPLTIMASKFWPVRHGGVEAHLWQMSRALASLNQPVRVLTQQEEALPEHQTVQPCLSVRRFEKLDLGRWWRWPHAMQVRWWKQVLEQEQPQGWLWATTPAMAVAAMLAGYRKQLVFNPACCVAAMRDVGSAHPHATTMQQPRLSKWIEHLAAAGSPRIVVSSKNLASQFQRHHGRTANVHVLPLATTASPAMLTRQAARAQWALGEHDFVVGFLGRLDPCKDVDFILKAMQSLVHNSGMHRQARPIKLLIAGEGPDHARLRQLAVTMNLGEHLVWTGDVKEPARALMAMDVLALTSLYEAYGLVILEAMACGVPVLGRKTNHQNILTACDEIITRGVDGLLVDSDHPLSLARHIQTLASVPVLCRTLANGAKRTAAAFTWERYARRCMNLMNLPALPAVPLPISDLRPQSPLVAADAQPAVSRRKAA